MHCIIWPGSQRSLSLWHIIGWTGSSSEYVRVPVHAMLSALHCAALSSMMGAHAWRSVDIQLIIVFPTSSMVLDAQNLDDIHTSASVDYAGRVCTRLRAATSTPCSMHTRVMCNMMLIPGRGR